MDLGSHLRSGGYGPYYLGFFGIAQIGASARNMACVMFGGLASRTLVIAEQCVVGTGQVHAA